MIAMMAIFLTMILWQAPDMPDYEHVSGYQIAGPFEATQ